MKPKSRLKIGIVTEYLDSSGGTPTILSNLVRHLSARYPDLQIEVISSRNIYRGDAKLPARENWQGVPVIRLNTPKSNRASTALRLAAGLRFTFAVFWRLLHRRPYDALLIVTNPPTLPLAIRAIKKIKKTPYLYLIHDLYPDVATVLGVLNRESRAARVLQRLQRGWLHAADKTLVLGRDMRDHLVDNYALQVERIEVVPNWCDPQEVTPLKTSRFRQEKGLRGTIALYAGNFGHYQTFDELLDAAGRLKDFHPAIQIVLVGGGAQDEHIRGRVAAEKLSNVRVFPMVNQKDYADVLAAADIALVTLARGAEGVGVPSKFYNILASGRPTVAVVAPNSEVALVLQEFEAGVQVGQGEAEKLAQVLADLADSPQEIERMGANARQALEENYTLDRVGQLFYRAIRQVASPEAAHHEGTQHEVTPL